MGAGSSVASAEEALAQGFTQEQIDAYRVREHFEQDAPACVLDLHASRVQWLDKAEVQTARDYNTDAEFWVTGKMLDASGRVGGDAEILAIEPHRVWPGSGLALAGEHVRGKAGLGFLRFPAVKLSGTAGFVEPN